INNAGCMVNQRELTEEGLEKNFATNMLGTFILTTALIPALKQAQDPRVMMSSGGMLVQKMSVDDLQSEKGTFDGTMAYPQNKHKEIHFSSMHPGWADTPGTTTDLESEMQTEIYQYNQKTPYIFVDYVFHVAVQLSMPDFHAKMKNKLRTVAMGADTVVWLAVSAAVPTHLPLASSRSSPADEKLQTTLEQLAHKFKPFLQGSKG
ncbi:unnamed protein product, partial [Coregonus sp. 'balchen']